MAFPDLSVLDDFNRADGDPGSAWTAAFVAADLDKPVIDTNRLKNQSLSATNTGMYWNVQEFVDGEVWMTVPVLPSPSTEDFFLVARVKNTARTGPPPSSGAWSGYQARILGNGNIFLSKYGGATRVDLRSATAVFAAGDSFGIRFEGSTLQLWRKPSAGAWVQVGADVTDSTYADSGYIGLEFDDATARADDFGGGAFGRRPRDPLIVWQPAVLHGPV